MPALWTTLLDVAFPPRCAACTRATVDQAEGERGLCHDCREDLPLLDAPVCRRCGSPAAGAASEDCPVCREERWAFDETIALGAYDGLLRHMVLLAKQPAGADGARALGELLAQRSRDRIAELAPAAVVAVPHHWRRRTIRRADGVGVLAEAIGRGCGVPTRRPLRRRRATAQQTSVAPSDRSANVRGAFTARSDRRITGRTVLLVDDVMTTGATCHEAARALKSSGAGRVVAVVAARRIGGL